MKIKLFIFAISLFFIQNILPQQLNVNEESKTPVNKAGQPYVRGPITPNVGSIDTTPLTTGFPGLRSGRALSQDDRINMMNSQINPNDVDPGKTYLSDVERANNDNGSSNKGVISLIAFITIIILIIWIFIQSKSNRIIYPIEKEVTKVFEPSKILTELEKLQSLRQAGVITEEEFEGLKKKILNNS
jgi:hypothetical protein